MFDAFSSGLYLQGVTRYRDQYAKEVVSRIVLDINLADDEENALPMLVDTGAPWCIMDPLEIEPIQNQVEPMFRSETPMSIRGITYTGWIYRVPMTIPAIEGEPLDVDATVFVPDLRAGETWLHPNFIGLDGFLNRIHFAINPVENLFYFGAV